MWFDMTGTESNLTWAEASVTPSEREALLRQRGCVVWFTGLSGSGKSTIASALERALFERQHAAFILDGDNVRHGLNRDLGFSAADRDENIRRLAEVAKLFADSGLICITAFISPFRALRRQAREIIGADRFVEVYLNVPLALCEQRDPKGLYKKARAGAIAEFTGIDSPYEPPDTCELTLDTGAESVEAGVARLLETLASRGLIGH
jgi:adenylylsulfate kinase